MTGDYASLLPPIRSALEDLGPVLLNAVALIVAHGCWLAVSRMKAAVASERRHDVRSRSRRETRS